MLIATIVVVAFLFILSYIIFDKDFLAPPTAVALVFLFGCFCAFYNEKRWGLEFSAESMFLIAAGIVATMLGAFIGVCITSKSRKRRIGFSFSHEITEPNEVFVSPIKTLIVIAFQLVALYLVFLHIRRLTGFSNWITAVASYRLVRKNANIDDLSIRMPFLTRNLRDASRMFAIAYAYIVGNNLIAGKKKLSLCWIPVVIYSITTFMQGDRSNMIRLWLEILVVAYTVHKRKVGWGSSRETRKVIRVMAASIILLGVVFAGVRELVGKGNDWDPLYYVTFYAGSPTAVLNQIVTTSFEPTVWGQRTMYFLNLSLTVFFGWPGKYNFYYEYFTSPTGAVIGNAPTAFAPAYREFGFFGFFLIMTAFGVFYMVLYCKCRTKQGSNPFDFRLMVYAHIAYVFLMYFYSTFFDFLGHVFIKYLIELWLIRWFLVGWQFKSRVKLTFGKKDRLHIENNQENSG